MSNSNAHDVRFGVDNLLQLSGVAITASTAVVTLPPTNVIHPFRTKIWKATDGWDDDYLDIDFGATNLANGLITVQDVFVFNINVTEMHNYDTVDGLAFTLLGSTNATHSPEGVNLPVSYESGIDSLRGRFSTIHNYRYWRLHSSYDGGYFGDNPTTEIGYMYMGVTTDLPYSTNFQLNYKDPSKSVYSLDGQRAAFARSQFRTVDFLIEEDLSSTTNLVAIFTAVGFSEDFVLSLDPSAVAFTLYPTAYQDYIMYGRLTKWNLKHMANGTYRVSASFEEAR